jgi:hypothetical protein
MQTLPILDLKELIGHFFSFGLTMKKQLQNGGRNYSHQSQKSKIGLDRIYSKNRDLYLSEFEQSLKP